MPDYSPAQEVFRITPDGKYMYNNQEVSKQEFDRRKAESSAEIQRMRPSMDRKVPLKERAGAAFGELDDDSNFKKGGRSKSMKSGKISTHQKSKKSPAW